MSDNTPVHDTTNEQFPESFAECRDPSAGETRGSTDLAVGANTDVTDEDLRDRGFEPDADTVWDYVGSEYVGEKPNGDHYLLPSIERIKRYIPWLADRDQWMIWELKNGDKHPHRGAYPQRKTEWQKPGNQVPLEEAWDAYQKYDHISGIGFVFHEDQDEGLEAFDGVIDPDAGALRPGRGGECAEDGLEHDGEFALFSSSASGAHRYPVMPDAEVTKKHPHEVYTSGRWAAVTGHPINPTSGDHGDDLSERVNELRETYNGTSNDLVRRPGVWRITTADVHNHPLVDCGCRWVLKTLHEFEAAGYLTMERDGRTIEWSPDGIRHANECGEVELPDVSLGEVEEVDYSEWAHNLVIRPSFGVLGGYEDDDGVSGGINDATDRSPDRGVGGQASIEAW